MLCRIAHKLARISAGFEKPGGSLFLTKRQSEQSRPSILSALSDHGVRDELFFSLFQVL